MGNFACETFPTEVPVLEIEFKKKVLVRTEGGQRLNLCPRLNWRCDCSLCTRRRWVSKLGYGTPTQDPAADGRNPAKTVWRASLNSSSKQEAGDRGLLPFGSFQKWKWGPDIDPE